MRIKGLFLVCIASLALSACGKEECDQECRDAEKAATDIVDGVVDRALCQFDPRLC